jgi:hypothetical protein
MNPTFLSLCYCWWRSVVEVFRVIPRKSRTMRQQCPNGHFGFIYLKIHWNSHLKIRKVKFERFVQIQLKKIQNETKKFKVFTHQTLLYELHACHSSEHLCYWSHFISHSSMIEKFLWVFYIELGASDLFTFEPLGNVTCETFPNPLQKMTWSPFTRETLQVGLPDAYNSLDTYLYLVKSHEYNNEHQERWSARWP